MRPVSGATKRHEIDRWATDTGDEMLLADGLDDAILGVIQQNDGQAVVLYDAEIAVQVLMRDSKMDRDAAQEYFEFNVLRAQGAQYPAFLVYRAPLFEPDRSH